MSQPPNNQPWQQPQQPNTFYPPHQPQYPPPPNTYYPHQQPWQLQPIIPPPPPPRPPRKKQNPWLILGIIAAILIIGGAISNAAKSSPTDTTATPTTALAATDTPTDTLVPTATLDASIPTSTPAPTQPPAKWTTTHTFSGTGDKTTATFDTSGDWRLVWTAQASSCCEAFFGASVYGSDRSFVDSGTDATIPAGKKGTDSTEEHTGAGSFYLKVYAGVPWTIQIQEFK